MCLALGTYRTILIIAYNHTCVCITHDIIGSKSNLRKDVIGLAFLRGESYNIVKEKGVTYETLDQKHTGTMER